MAAVVAAVVLRNGAGREGTYIWTGGEEKEIEILRQGVG
jgi:hypothetical protein